MPGTAKDILIIPEKEKQVFLECGANIGNLIRKGKYGAVFEGQFTDKFDAKQFSHRIKGGKCIAKEVTKCKDKFAVKFVNVLVREQLGNTDVRHGVKREFDVLLKCYFKFIVDVYFVVSFDKSENYYFILELAEENLDQYLSRSRMSNKKLKEVRAKEWISSLASAVKYLHENGICHKNIKLSNVLIFAGSEQPTTHPTIKLADFVCAKVFDQKEMKDLLFEDDSNGDVIDLYMVITEILSQTQLETDAIIVYEVVRQLVGSGFDSRTVLKSLLKQKRWAFKNNA